MDEQEIVESRLTAKALGLVSGRYVLELLCGDCKNSRCMHLERRFVGINEAAAIGAAHKSGWRVTLYTVQCPLCVALPMRPKT